MTRRRFELWFFRLAALAILAGCLAELLHAPAQPPAPPDDTAALQAFIDARQPLPAGRFTTLAPLQLRGPGWRCVGAGPDATVINYRGKGAAFLLGYPQYDRTNPATAANWTQLRLSDVTLDGTGSGPGSVGVDLYGCTRFTVARVNAHHFGYAAFHARSCWVGSLSDCRAADSRYGLKCTHPGAPGGQSWNALTLSGGEWGPGTRCGIMVGEEDQPARTQPVIGSVLNIDGATIEGARQWGIWAVDGNQLNVTNSYLEANSKAPDPGSLTGHIRLGNAGCWLHGASVRGCHFAGMHGPNPTLGASVYADNVRFLTVDGNRFDPAQAGVYGVKVRQSENGRIPTEPSNFFAANVRIKVGP